MPKVILITGGTDGIGRATARYLAEAGHDLLIHGRNAAKLADVAEELGAIPTAGPVETYQADLSDLSEVARLARGLRDTRERIDVLINNAGVLKTDRPITASGDDVRFVVNTLAPALLTRLLLPVIPAKGRIVHLSSAAQAPVDLEAMTGQKRLDTMDAYAQSKLALTMWSAALSAELGPDGPVSVAVNPGSLLATNMVRQGFGVAGNDIAIGADILTRASLSEEFGNATGRYFDNDSGQFAAPHGDAGNPAKVIAVVAAIEARIAPYLENANAGS